MIYLHGDHYIPKGKCPWQTEDLKIQGNKYLINDENNAEKDYSGYETCLRIHNIVSNEPEKYGKIATIDYCLILEVNGYQGYLPSMGQLRIMHNNIDMINYVFNYLKLNEIECLDHGWWGSSTECSNYYSWGLNYGRTNYGNKVYYYGRIFPLFAVKKN